MEEHEQPTIIYVNEITMDTAIKFIENMDDAYADGVTNIIVNVCSDGGDPRAMYAMLDTINAWPCMLCICGIGACSSSAADLLFCVQGHDRYAAPSAEFLIHGSAVSIDNSQGIGLLKRRKMERRTKERIDHKIISMIATNCGVKYDFIRRKIKENDGEWVLSAEDALEMGFVDYIGVPGMDWC